MTSTARKRHWIWRLAKIVVIAEIVYLAVFNLALRTPATQDLINIIRPDKFEVSWQKAWTWHPFRLHAVGVSANGQSRGQQWQLDATSLSGSISVLPLLLKRVWINDVIANDISYKQRPRLKPDKDYEAILPYFPDIEGRPISDAITTPRKKKRPWRLAIDGIEAHGRHEYWIMQFKGGLTGTFGGDLTFESAGGPLAIDDAQLDVTLDTLYINDNHKAFDLGSLKGTFDFAPFVPRENRGLRALRFLSVDAELGLQLNSLAFINLFTRNFGDMGIDGKGRVGGHLKLELGNVLPGTDLAVDADDLLVNMLGHRIDGEGTVEVKADASNAGFFTIAIDYGDLEVTREGTRYPVLTGQQLGLDMTGPSSLLVERGKPGDDRHVQLTVDKLAAPDLALLQSYLPDKWPLNLYAGQGVVHGTARLSSNAVDIDINLGSEELYLGFMDYRLRTNLDLAIKLNNPSISSDSTLISGSYIKFTEVGLSRESRDKLAPGKATLVINDGHLGMAAQDAENSGDLLRLLGEMEGKELLSTLYGSIGFESSISTLGWISVLLKDGYNTAIDGSGDISGRLNIEDALPAPGTDIEVISTNLIVDVLDYRSAGTGKVAMKVEQGKLDPDWTFAIQLQDASLMRQSESQSSIENVNLIVAAKVEDVARGKSDPETTLALRIDSAHVTNLSIFNRYLPAGSPLQLTRGSAALAADILLRKENARGWLTLDSGDLEFSIDDQTIQSDLAVSVTLAGGVPRDMQFDISGSQIKLDNVRVTGDNTNFDEDLWSAKLVIEQGDTVWKKPVSLDARARVEMLDTRPFVAVFENQKSRPQWLLETLTVRDIEGNAVISMADENIVISKAHVTADKMELGAKGQINKTTRNGVFYARYKKLDAIMKINDGKRNVDVIQARDKYDDYRAQQTTR